MEPWVTINALCTVTLNYSSAQLKNKIVRRVLLVLVYFSFPTVATSMPPRKFPSKQRPSLAFYCQYWICCCLLSLDQCQIKIPKSP